MLSARTGAIVTEMPTTNAYHGGLLWRIDTDTNTANTVYIQLHSSTTRPLPFNLDACCLRGLERLSQKCPLLIRTTADYYGGSTPTRILRTQCIFNSINRRVNGNSDRERSVEPAAIGLAQATASRPEFGFRLSTQVHVGRIRPGVAVAATSPRSVLDRAPARRWGRGRR